MVGKTIKPIECRGRWHFLDDDGEEVERKNYATKRIDQFWKEFRASELCDPKADVVVYREKARPWLLEHLPLAEPRLEWEVFFNSDGKSQLSICLGGLLSQWRLLETFVERAGEFDGWEILAGRTPIELGMCDISAVFRERLRMTLPPFRFEVRVEKDSSISVTLFSPVFSKTDSTEDITVPFFLSEMLLGEYEGIHWVVRHEAVYEQIDESNFDHNRVCKELKKVLDEQIQLVKSKIEDPPRALWSEEHPTVMMEFTPQDPSLVAPGRRFRMTAITCNTELVCGFPPPTMFFSDRFAKNGGKFAYLQVINVATELTQEFREAFEDEMIAALLKSNSGYMVATGRGEPDSYYYDFCLTNVDKAVVALQGVVQRYDLPKTCWLRFYDRHWNEEWVRMYPETPDLEKPDEVW
ncbi:hypothetical protein BH11CYA1_BH11CYA1_04480 [soil metagenome]